MLRIHKYKRSEDVSAESDDDQLSGLVVCATLNCQRMQNTYFRWNEIVYVFQISGKRIYVQWNVLGILIVCISRSRNRTWCKGSSALQNI